MKGKGRMIRNAVSAAVAGAGLLAGSVLAQEGFLGDWNQEQAYDGWSAERFLDEAEVYGAGGEEIGTVENFLINEEGEIVALIAQVGGFWDIADTHVAVPWDQATIEGTKVTIPITEDTADNYSMFADQYFTQADVGSLETVEDDVQTGPVIWKATDLIDDYAVLETGAGYGYVNDLIFDDKGQLQAVVVNATEYAAPGYYAYPWYGEGYEGYAWEPGLDRYVLPFDQTEIAALDNTFEYGELEGAQGAAGAASKESQAASKEGQRDQKESQRGQ